MDGEERQSLPLAHAREERRRTSTAQPPGQKRARSFANVPDVTQPRTSFVRFPIRPLHLSYSVAYARRRACASSAESADQNGYKTTAIGRGAPYLPNFEHFTHLTILTCTIIMFFLGRPAQYSPSYPTHSTPSSYHPRTSSYYPDISYDDILDNDTFPELDVMPHAHQYAGARGYAMHQACEHAIPQPREHVYLAEVARAQQAREAEERRRRAQHIERAYLAEVARAQQAREAEHRLKIRQAEQAYFTQVTRAQQAREEAQLRLRAQRAEQARLAQARVLEEAFAATVRLADGPWSAPC
jgi:hypothetical protein